jgi:hypothetical protein
MFNSHYKARSERTDEAERGLIPAIRRTYAPEITLGDMAEALGVELQAEDERLIEAMRGAEQLPYTFEEALARREEANVD